MSSTMNNWLSHPMEELNGLKHHFDETLKNWTSSLTHPTSEPTDWGWKPRMDVCESKDNYKIILELPGFQRDDLDVQVNGRFLSIKGSKFEKSTDEWKFHRRERYSGGEFHRAVALPEGIDGSSIQAKFQGGMLTLTIPKTGGKNTQHITLLGSEEHSNLRSVIEAEEAERRRRIQDFNPTYLKSGVNSKIGSFMEEGFGNRRLFGLDKDLAKNSNENRIMSKRLEMNERDRRVRDKRGEDQKKLLANKVSKMVKPNSSVQLQKLKHVPLFKSSHQMEEKERTDRMRDKRGQEISKSNAKKVSNMIKSSGRHQLRRTPSKSSFHPSGKNSFHKNTSKFAQIRVHPHTEPFHGKKSCLAVHQMEEKERNRRMADKNGQQLAKKNAKKISDMVKRSGKKSLHHVSRPSSSFSRIPITTGSSSSKYNSHSFKFSNFGNMNTQKINACRHMDKVEEKERNRRLADKNGQQIAKKNAKKIADMVKKSGGKSRLHPSPHSSSKRDIHHHTSTHRTISLEEKERQRRLKDKKGQADAKKNAMKISKMVEREGNRANLHKGSTNLSKINAGKHMNKIEEKERSRRIADKKGMADCKKNAKKVSDMIKKSEGVNMLKVNHDSPMKHHDNRQLDLIEEKERTRRLKDKKGQVDAKKLANLISQMVKGSGGKTHLNPHPLSATKMEYNKSTNKFLGQLEEKERERRLKDKKGQADAKKTAKKIAGMIGRASC
ncbi:heat shock protein Hsp20 domain-containing protein [Heterostelium album PN500]|uniref:Heat shock protein Hsp20 domain-containing protein n=1 Tax=Heterostelium pallidum (strain ATCC 26659 / Pp 5 / PN500) TaxID=670386 RepID=D3BKI6_HETP5|nr:heat shock protein Hsp20 domain-containing protein [Heterostelium album PN500]EFA78416.1 heat shock protein Hsp20 domain-containing protein [Heterostelium album PN500]|eukprot:XP_020430541.1 heat shock protein Hsp20 domain-containing protein [Heterostelium album PN500]